MRLENMGMVGTGTSEANYSLSIKCTWQLPANRDDFRRQSRVIESDRGLYKIVPLIVDLGVFP
jgi:hypothetical protein